MLLRRGAAGCAGETLIVRLQVTNVLREIDVKHNLGRFGPSYDMLREATSASDLAVLRVLRTNLCASDPWPTTTRNPRMAALLPQRTRRGKMVAPLQVATVLSFHLISKVPTRILSPADRAPELTCQHSIEQPRIWKVSAMESH